MTKFLAAAAGVLFAACSIGVVSASCDSCMRDLGRDVELKPFTCEQIEVDTLVADTARCASVCSFGKQQSNENDDVALEIAGCNIQSTLPACASCLVAKIASVSGVDGKLTCDLLETDMCKSECVGEVDIFNMMARGLSTLRNEILYDAECFRRDAGRPDEETPNEQTIPGIPDLVPALECVSCIANIWDPTKVDSSPADNLQGMPEIEGITGLSIPTNVTKELCAKGKAAIDGLTGCLAGENCKELNEFLDKALDQALQGIVESYGTFCDLDINGFSQADRCTACLKSATDGIIAAVEGSTPVDKCELHKVIMDNIDVCVKEGGDCAQGAVDTMVVKKTLQTSVNIFGLDDECEGQVNIVVAAKALGITLEQQDAVNVKWAGSVSDGNGNGDTQEPGAAPAAPGAAPGVNAGLIAGSVIGSVACIAGMAVVYKRTRHPVSSSSTALGVSDRGPVAIEISEGKSSDNPMFNPMDI